MVRIIEWFDQYRRDNRGRMVYFRAMSKRGYVVSEGNSLLGGVLHERLVIAIFISCALELFNVNPIVNVATFVVVYLALSWWLIEKFLPKKELIENYTFSDYLKDTQANLESKSVKFQSLIRLILSVVFILLSVWIYLFESTTLLQFLLLLSLGLSFATSAAINLGRVIRG